MITNLPSHKQFKKSSQQTLTQSFNLLFKVYQDYYHDDEIVVKEVPLDRFWSYNFGTIQTSLILLHQGIETSMKSIICQTSPLLLIEKNRKDWPTLPSKDDKDFDSLYTISGESLLTTFCAVESKITITNELIEFIEDIRKKRNQAVHGLGNPQINASELLENILKAYTYFYGKSDWFYASKIFNFENPLFGYFDSDYEYAISYEYLGIRDNW